MSHVYIVKGRFLEAPGTDAMYGVYLLPERAVEEALKIVDKFRECHGVTVKRTMPTSHVWICMNAGEFVRIEEWKVR